MNSWICRLANEQTGRLIASAGGLSIAYLLTAPSVWVSDTLTHSTLFIFEAVSTLCYHLTRNWFSDTTTINHYVGIDRKGQEEIDISINRRQFAPSKPHRRQMNHRSCSATALPNPLKYCTALVNRLLFVKGIHGMSMIYKRRYVQLWRDFHEDKR